MTPQGHAIPAEVAPVLAFVNSIDVEEGTDEWADGPAAFGRWLVEAQLAPPGLTVTPAEYAWARDLRAGLRAMTLANNGIAPATEIVELLRRTLAAVPLVVQPEPPGISALVGQHSSAAYAALGSVVTGYAYALVTGQWHRLRQCPASDCAWVFWDSSSRAARRWCTMGVCGNRAKARAYAARRRQPSPTTDTRDEEV